MKGTALVADLFVPCAVDAHRFLTATAYSFLNWQGLPKTSYTLWKKTKLKVPVWEDDLSFNTDKVQRFTKQLREHVAEEHGFELLTKEETALAPAIEGAPVYYVSAYVGRPA